VVAFIAFTAMAAGAIVISASLRSGPPPINAAPGLELLWIAVVATRTATGRIQKDVSGAGWMPPSR
jgi:hypothetical protein